MRLSALAQLFARRHHPTHRALDDARATVDVLHALIERVGNQGVHTYADLRSYLPDVTPAQRRKRPRRRPAAPARRLPVPRAQRTRCSTWAPRSICAAGSASTSTAPDPRTRMKEMASLATRVDHVECAHELEAGVRELRLLAAHAPPYNRRSKFPHRWWWVVLTDEAFPRFSVVRTPSHDRAIGPFRARADAVDTADLLARFTGVRTCTTRLGRSALHGPPAPQRELSPCPARRATRPRPSTRPRRSRRGADRRAGQHRAGRRRAARSPSSPRAARYESAARLRDHAAAAIEVLWRGQRLRALAAVRSWWPRPPTATAAGTSRSIRRGQLAAAGTARRGVPPMPVVDAICAGAQAILPQPAPLGGALVEETALIARWLADPGVRIVRVTGGNAATGWGSPVGSAGRWAEWAASARSARAAAEQAVTSRAQSC